MAEICRVIPAFTVSPLGRIPARNSLTASQFRAAATIRLPRPNLQDNSCRISERLCAVSGLLLLQSRHAFLHLPGEVRGNSEHALHQHQLRAMVHLMLLGGKQPLQPGSRSLIHLRREADRFGEHLVRQAFQECGVCFAILVQRFQNVGLGMELRFRGGERGHHFGEHPELQFGVPFPVQADRPGRGDRAATFGDVRVNRRPTSELWAMNDGRQKKVVN